MVLGVIPARCLSKRIPHKNIRIIAGKPLIVWTIQAAQSAKMLDRFIVSTEDAQIASLAKEYGAEVLPRSPQLSADDTPMLDVLST